MISFLSEFSENFYENFFKDILFRFDPTEVHTTFLKIGQELGHSSLASSLIDSTFSYSDPALGQKIDGNYFPNPIGLAAGFDYEGQLTQILPKIGFGFGTIGTITLDSYKGNPAPMLGRLPKSKSLMVNKGFKNKGIKQTLIDLRAEKFTMPVGISIGKTNTLAHKTQTQAEDDIVKSFKILQNSKVKFAYYELNISCPNLMGDIEFYSPEKLKSLLTKIVKLNLTKPVYIKMPITKTNNEVLEMLKVISQFPIKGVVFGNLQKDRKHKTLVKSEVEKFSVGNFSGKPCEERSNELIALCHKHYKGKLLIIGCGGVFSGKDAYKKIKLGANLVQLATGLVYKGPTLPGRINMEIAQLLKKDGFEDISQAVGTISQ